MNREQGEQSTVPPDGRPEAEQPAWRQDFPIDWPQDHYVARRDFTKFLTLTSLAFVIGQVWIGIKSLLGRRGPEAQQAVARLADIPVGGFLVFHYPGANDPCLLVRPAEETLQAYSQKCTHLACAVVPDLGQGRLHCPCHRGYFDLANGRPVAGPPRRPLAQITLTNRGGVLYATGVEVRE